MRLRRFEGFLDYGWELAEILVGIVEYHDTGIRAGLAYDLVAEAGKSLEWRCNDEQSVCVLIKTEFVAVATDDDTRNLLSVVSRLNLFFGKVGR